ncbi:MAG: TetR/AcrR family transcriptional regulator [Saprospiraceae bacterium]
MSSKKEIIYNAAAKLFRDKGYKSASVRDLAKAVNLQASSLYSHIGSKEEILREICFTNAHRFVKGMDQVEIEGGTTIDKIRALIALHVKIATEDTTSVTVFNGEWKHLSEPYLSDFLKLRKNYEKRFRAIIAAGVKGGELKDVNVNTAFFMILTSIQWLHFWYDAEKNMDIEKLQLDIEKILIKGLQN